MNNIIKVSISIITFLMAMPLYADTDLDHGSEIKAHDIREAEAKTDAALDETIANTIESTKESSVDTDLDHGSEIKAEDIREAEAKSDTALEKTIENTKESSS